MSTKPFIKLFVWILNLDISASEKIMLAQICSLTASFGEAKISYPKLAKNASCSERSANKHISSLEAKGLITKQVGKGVSSNVYKPCSSSEEFALLDKANEHKNSATSSENIAVDKRKNCATSSEEFALNKNNKDYSIEKNRETISDKKQNDFNLTEEVEL